MSGTTEPRKIVELIGRWALLDNGDLVTAIPAFHEFGYDERAFDAAVAEFHRHPEEVLGRGYRVAGRADG